MVQADGLRLNKCRRCAFDPLSIWFTVSGQFNDKESIITCEGIIASYIRAITPDIQDFLLQ